MSDRKLAVYLDGRRCGDLTQSDAGNLTFAYDAAYRVAGDATPLSLSMPLAAVSHKKKAVLPFLQGLFPDNDDALGALARRYSVSARNPFALAEQVGQDLAGALQIVGMKKAAADATARRTRVRRVSDAEIGTMLQHVVAEYTGGTVYDDAVGRFSLAGAQPKIALHRTDAGDWAMPEDATPTTHILKPVVPGSLRRTDVVERMTLHAAAFLGNTVAQSELVSIAGWDVLVSTRYDRARVDGVWHRLHQEDLCQALSVSPSKKYQHLDGGPGLAQISALIRSLPIEADRRAVGEGFYRAFVFNVVAGCTDAHAKNYSLLLEGRSVRLAPLYDLLSYAGYWDGEASISSAMSVAGEYSLRQIGGDVLAAEGARFGVGPGEAGTIVQSTREGMVDAFESARTSIEGYGKAAEDVADSVLTGIRRLPLVLV